MKKLQDEARYEQSIEKLRKIQKNYNIQLPLKLSSYNQAAKITAKAKSSPKPKVKTEAKSSPKPKVKAETELSSNSKGKTETQSSFKPKAKIEAELLQPILSHKPKVKIEAELLQPVLSHKLATKSKTIMYYFLNSKLELENIKNISNLLKIEKPTNPEKLNIISYLQNENTIVYNESFHIKEKMLDPTNFNILVFPILLIHEDNNSQLIIIISCEYLNKEDKTKEQDYFSDIVSSINTYFFYN